MSEREHVLGEVASEHERQNVKWGEQNHPDGTGSSMYKGLADTHKVLCSAAASKGLCTWRHILQEEVAEAFAESDPVRLREELVQVAAVAVQWIEAIDRRAKA